MFRYYLKLGTLSIRANPALSFLMVAAIAIGIGACMTIFTVRYIMSGNPIEHKNDQLYHVQVDSWNPDDPYEDPDLPPEQLTYLDAKALFDASRAFRQTTSYKISRVVQPEDDDARPFQTDGRATTADFFPMFDVPFLYGSGWDNAADATEERVVVLSRDLNEKVFGGENSVGRILTINGESFRVSGVLDEWTPVPKFSISTTIPMKSRSHCTCLSRWRWPAGLTAAVTRAAGNRLKAMVSRRSWRPSVSGFRCGSSCRARRRKPTTCSSSTLTSKSRNYSAVFPGR